MKKQEVRGERRGAVGDKGVYFEFQEDKMYFEPDMAHHQVPG
jgi:hypothetical protein